MGGLKTSEKHKKAVKNIKKTKGVCQGVAMASIKYHSGPPCPTLLCLAGGLPLKRPYGLFRVALPQGGRPATVFYPFGHPTPYLYEKDVDALKVVGNLMPPEEDEEEKVACFPPS
jgi:hypothetical protein